ncbi:polyprenol phosphomannose-dependent alpha 1,6 mannosyltransferase MptB [Pedobacter cryophilus]|uniref:Mannosyltransferase n=1 Tax=Pedobacter cryophilus TaxID=2571271 RepID=A0A4U1BZ27_9SPHI|nr:polyprenol phosphomannose-dependent alpha 1,6 mannosyltransferase MptB [Pedobacter cryophilus]TKB96943.1 hypothetical protein FA046_12790 [Pedobacter cryophilus]
MENSSSKIHLSWYIFLAILFLVALYQLAYLTPNRTDIASIWTFLALAFIAYFSILKRFNDSNHQKLNLGLAIISRLLLLFSFPLLSDDIYRFIWDGSLILHGINPFSFTPQELMLEKLDWLDPLLFQKMNSPAYYSVYPPINQLAFLLSAIPGKGNLLASVIILRIFILAFDIGNIFILKKLLRFFKKDERLVFIYALNPLVIIEFTGNLHFEAVMIFFTLLSVWLLHTNKWILASLALTLAISAKLLPIIFLPLFIHHIGWKKTFYAGLFIGFTTLILFLPFIHNLELAANFLQSIQLYYGKFEFNGSVYQLLKEVGWKILHYNPIAYTSKILLAFTLIGFLITYIKSKNIIEGIFWLLFIYTLFGAIVHPWYMLILVAFTPFLKWRFAIVWSVLICLSYFTYRVIPYQEEMFLVWIEYGLLGLFMFYELVFKPRRREIY